jgi:Glycosyl transferases group 1/SEC-C motif
MRPKAVSSFPFPRIFFGKTTQNMLSHSGLNILYSTHTAPNYIPPLLISDRQIIVGPNYPDVKEGGRHRSIRVAPGRYDLGALVASLPEDQKPQLTVVLIDSFQGCVPENLSAVPGRKLLLIADTHHGDAPLRKCMAYARQHPFDRVALIHDPHHLHWFTEAQIAPTTYIPNVNVSYFPQQFSAHRSPHIVFVGQAGQWHRRRSRLLSVIQHAGLPLVMCEGPAPAAAAIYASSQIAFNCSLNGDLNMRVFETMASGGFLITDRLSPQSNLEALFVRDEHYVDYENEYDLLTKLRHYLAHPHECLKIARAGQEEYLKNHQPAQRVDELLAFAFGDGTAVRPRDRRAVAGGDGFGHNLNERVQLYEICQNLSLQNERLIVVFDAALGERPLADLVDLPRLKIRVAFGERSVNTDSLNGLGVLDQVELVRDEPGPCDVLVVEALTIKSWTSIPKVSAQLVLVMDTTNTQTGWLATQGFSKLGEKLWAYQTPSRRNSSCPCGSGKKYKHCHGALQ